MTRISNGEGKARIELDAPPRSLGELMPELEEALNDEQLAAVATFAANALRLKKQVQAEQHRNEQLTAALGSTGNFLAALVKRQGGRLRLRASEVEATEGEVQRRVSCEKGDDGSYVLLLEDVPECSLATPVERIPN